MRCDWKCLASTANVCDLGMKPKNVLSAPGFILGGFLPWRMEAGIWTF